MLKNILRTVARVLSVLFAGSALMSLVEADVRRAATRFEAQCATVFNGPFGRLMNHTSAMVPSIRSVARA